MTRFENQTSPLLGLAIGLAIGAVFWADLNSTLGVAVWVFYTVPVVMGLWSWRPRIPIYTAAACSVLTGICLLVSPASAQFSSEYARLNRSFGLLTTWAVAIIVRQFITTKLAVNLRDWVRSGVAELSRRMQGEQKLDELADNVIRFLCGYVGAPVGVVYVAEEGGGRLRRAAGFGLDPGSLPQLVGTDQGLVGQAAREQRGFAVHDVPAGHLPLHSALGERTPHHLSVIPAAADGATRAVIELGFFERTGRAEQDFCEACAQPVAMAVRSAEFRARLQELLAETQRQAEALQAQQEELRVSNEELAEQGNVLRESQARLETQQSELEHANAQLEEQAQALEVQRSDLESARDELQRRAAELARSNQFKSEFLANMSHELRTPLNSSLILAKLLADNRDGNLTAEQIKYAQTIYSAGNDLLALINDVLDLSRIEAGRLDLHPEPVELARTVAALAREFEPAAQEKRLAFVTSIAPGLPASIRTDPRRLQQVLKNLLSNAFKFTPAGQVSLAVQPAAGGRIAFAVRDTGIGIPRDKQELIFEAFRQVDGGTHRQYGGTGLGLSISRDLAQRLGGEIRVDSEPGQGSTFTLVIGRDLGESAAESAPAPRPVSAPTPPLAQPPGLVPQSAPGAQAQALGGAAALRPVPPPSLAVPDDRQQMVPGARAVLVIEDDARFAHIVHDLAHEQQFLCLIAPTVAEGLELARAYRPSAIVLDINLPDESGLALLDRLKGSSELRHIPVHVISISDYTEQAMQLGAVGYALKPVKREELERAFARLREHIGRKTWRVLVVEDNEAQREGVRQLLAGDGVEVIGVATAAKALQQLAGTTFDCMVLDLALPDISGFELLDEMARSEALSFPPVIVYTGRALSADEEQRLRGYSHSIVIKGARSPERLLDEVSLFLHRVDSELPPEQQRMVRQARAREAAFEGRRILLAEDDVRNIFALSSVLEAKGARMEIARNGKEALAALGRYTSDGKVGVDLVLMDIMMPEMDGLTAMREIRKRPECRRLPIVALTAKAMPEDREKCLAAGASDYIAKPLDVEKLLSLLRVWMPR